MKRARVGRWWVAACLFLVVSAFTAHRDNQHRDQLFRRGLTAEGGARWHEAVVIWKELGYYRDSNRRLYRDLERIMEETATARGDEGGNAGSIRLLLDSEKTPRYRFKQAKRHR